MNMLRRSVDTHRARRLLTAALAAVLAVACADAPLGTRASSDDDSDEMPPRFSRESHATTTLKLVPPAGAPYPDAFANGKIRGGYLDGEHPLFAPLQGLDLEIKNLPCRNLFVTAGSNDALSRQFYSVSVTAVTSGTVRIFSFNTECVTGNQSLGLWVPSDVPFFLEDVTVRVFLESDDGADGPDGAGVLLLEGTAPADS